MVPEYQLCAYLLADQIQTVLLPLTASHKALNPSPRVGDGLLVNNIAGATINGDLAQLDQVMQKLSKWKEDPEGFIHL